MAVRPLLKITHVRIHHGINSLSVKTINWSIAPRGIISITGGHLLPTLSDVNKVIKTKDVIWVIGCKFLPHALSKISRILIGILFSECSYIGLKIVSVLYSTEYCAMLKEKKLLTFVYIGQVTNADTKLCSSPRSDFLYHPHPPPPTLIFRTGYTKCLAYPRTRRPSTTHLLARTFSRRPLSAISVHLHQLKI